MRGAVLVAILISLGACRQLGHIEHKSGCVPGCRDAQTRVVCADDGTPHTETCAGETPWCAATPNLSFCNECAPRSACGRGLLGTCNEAGICLGQDLALSAKSSHTCARTHAGGIYCWGANFVGELGDGTVVNRSTPVRARGLPSARSIHVGYGHTCAITNEGDVWCWGDDEGAQLGNDALAFSPPVLVPTKVQGIANVAMLEPAFGFTCALTTGGDVYCWGDNRYGQIGQGTFDPLVIGRPTKVKGLPNPIRLIVANRDSACAIDASARLFCWGYNAFGQLGLGDTESRALPALVTLSGDGARNVSQSYKSTCALGVAGIVECFGANERAQLGNGTESQTPKLVPGKVLQQNLTPLQNARSLLSSASSLVCARIDNWACWGTPAPGQLASGSADESPITKAQTVPDWPENVALGDFYGCGIYPGNPPDIRCFGQADLLGLGLSPGPAVLTAQPVSWAPLEEN